jgi:hypothetical protein
MTIKETINMKNFRYLFLILFIAGFPYYLVTAQEVKSDAVLLNLVKEYRLNDDGSMELRVVKDQKLLTHFAFHSLYGETFIIFDPVQQELIFNEAYTVMADGKKVVTPENAFNEVLPRLAANFPSVNHLREMVVTHTGLEVGATVHLDYTIKTKPGHFPALMAQEVLVSSCPVQEQVLSVDIPAGSGLHHKTLNIRTAPEITEGNGRKKYVWTFSNLPARSFEPFQPDDPNHYPTVVFSTANDLFLTVTALTSQPAFRYEMNPQMANHIDTITVQQEDVLKRILDIQKLVVDKIAYFEVPLEYTGYRLRTPAEVWESNGGTEAEKAVLLCTLLKNAGIRSSVYGIIPTKVMDKTIGCLQSLKGFVVEVSAGTEERLYLSPVRLNDQTLLFELAGNSLILLNPAVESLKVADVPVQPASVEADFILRISPEEHISGTFICELGYAFNPFLGLTRNEQLMKNQWTLFASSGQVKSFRVSSASADHSQVEYEIEDASPMKQQSGYIFLELPVFRNGFNAWQMNYLNATRTTSLKIPFPFSESYSYTIELPEGSNLVTNPTEDKIANTAGAFQIKIQQKGKEVTVFRSLELSSWVTGQESYNDLRVLITEWCDINKRRVVFRAGD